ncbi:hypothetical protein SCYAM73S_04191 [Streptomyces cyaneofuscatus]
MTTSATVRSVPCHWVRATVPMPGIGSHRIVRPSMTITAAAIIWPPSLIRASISNLSSSTPISQIRAAPESNALGSLELDTLQVEEVVGDGVDSAHECTEHRQSHRAGVSARWDGRVQVGAGLIVADRLFNLKDVFSNSPTSQGRCSPAPPWYGLLDDKFEIDALIKLGDEMITAAVMVIQGLGDKMPGVSGWQPAWRSSSSRHGRREAGGGDDLAAELDQGVDLELVVEHADQPDQGSAERRPSLVVES